MVLGRLIHRLSGKLLFLTILFVMVSEVLIYVPSVANFRLTWLSDRLASARTAALVLDIAPQGMVPTDLRNRLLESAGAHMIALRTHDTRRLLAISDMPPNVDVHIDMRQISEIQAITQAFESLLAPHGRIMRVVGEAPMSGDFIEIILDEGPLKAAMLNYSANILILSLIISALTAAFVYITLTRLFVRPMQKLTSMMLAFREDPQDPTRIIAASHRQDEIGQATNELAAMQRELASMLNQKSRLAQLGLAVAKISHDLRNMLTAAQLFVDRIAALTDPTVQRVAPKLVEALERAIALCEATLSYGKAQEQPPQRQMVDVAALIEDVRESLDLSRNIKWVTAIEHDLTTDADPHQLFRIIFNLTRNAAQALQGQEQIDPDRDQIRISGRREGSVTEIEVSDTGPGLSTKAKAHLFEAFQGSTRQGGTGLGLAIAAELVQAHSGDIRYVEGTIGATFRITLPDQPLALAERRKLHQA